MSTDANLPPLYVAVRQATEALAEAEQRRSLRLSLDSTLAKEVRRLVELEAALEGEKVGILALAKLDIDKELARIARPQDLEEVRDPELEGLRLEVATCRSAVNEINAEANELSETKETLQYARRRLDNALESWEASLRAEATEPARQLQRIDTDQARFMARMKEIGDAIYAATEVSKGLAATEEALARMIDGTFGQTTKELADNAVKYFAEVTRWLLLLVAELDDLGEAYSPAIESPKPVLDVISHIYKPFDTSGALDWPRICLEIKIYRNGLRETRASVTQLLRQLRNDRNQTDAAIEALDVKRWELLLGPPLAT